MNLKAKIKKVIERLSRKYGQIKELCEIGQTICRFMEATIEQVQTELKVPDYTIEINAGAKTELQNYVKRMQGLVDFLSEIFLDIYADFRRGQVPKEISEFSYHIAKIAESIHYAKVLLEGNVILPRKFDLMYLKNFWGNELKQSFSYFSNIDNYLDVFSEKTYMLALSNSIDISNLLTEIGKKNKSKGRKTKTKSKKVK